MEQNVKIVLPDITVAIQDKQVNYILLAFKNMIDALTSQITVSESLKLQKLYHIIIDAINNNAKELELTIDEFKTMQSIVLNSKGIGNFELQMNMLRIFEQSIKEYNELTAKKEEVKNN